MADILSQILSSGMLNYGQPNPLDRGLMGGDPSMQLGMQMLANSGGGHFGGLLGRSMLGMQDAQQKNALSQLDLLTKGVGVDQTMQMWPYLQQAMGQAFGQPGQPGLGAQPANPQQVPGAPTAGPAQPGQPQGQPQQPQQQGMGPMGGVGSPDALANLGGISAFMGRPGGQQLIDLAKFRMDNDPAHATQMAAAKGEIAQDMALFQQAHAAGNVPVAQAAYTKLLKDSGMLNVGSMNGNVTTFGGITPQQLGMNSVSPQHGTQVVNGVQSAMPGAPQAAATMAGAEAQGKATGETIPVTDYSGAPGFATKSTVTGGGGAPSAKASSAVPGAPSVASGAGRTPSQFKTGDPQVDKALADPDYKLPRLKPGQSAPPAVIEARKDLLKDSGTATEAAAQALQYTKAAQQIMDGKGAPVVGLYGPAVAEISRIWGGVNATNYQEVAKYLGNAALQNAKGIYGPKMTQSEVKLQLNELSPSTHMTSDAIRNLLANNSRSAQYTIDSAKRASAYLKAGNDPQNFWEWNQQHFAREDVVNNAGAHPADIQALLSKYGGK